MKRVRKCLCLLPDLKCKCTEEILALTFLQIGIKQLYEVQV